jgi:hypothetical protein
MTVKLLANALARVALVLWRLRQGQVCRTARQGPGLFDAAELLNARLLPSYFAGGARAIESWWLGICRDRRL